MLFRTWRRAGIGRWKDPLTDAGCRDRPVADTEECNRSDGEQDDGRGADKTDEGEMEEHTCRRHPFIASADDGGCTGIAFGSGPGHSGF